MSSSSPVGDQPSRTAVVTGTIDAVAEAVVRRMSGEGYRVVVVGHAPRRLGERLIATDLTDEQEVADALRRAAERLGSIDALVNVVGSPRGATDDQLRRDIPAAVSVAYLCCKHGVRHVRARGASTGSLTNVVRMSSTGTLSTATGGASQAAVMTAAIALTQGLAVQHAPGGLRVNAVMVGPTVASSEQSASGATDLTPMRRSGTPDDVAAAVVFLAGADASHITGAQIAVDGGLSAASRMRAASLDGAP